MTDKPYTPTTQHVQNAYVDTRYNLASEQDEFPPPIMERYAEFDRWLATIEAAAEQRGAIKALRDAATQMENTADNLGNHYMLPGGG